MGYSRYICLTNPQDAKAASTRITYLLNNAFVKTSPAQQPDRFSSFLQVSGTCSSAADIKKVHSSLNLNKISFCSKIRLPSAGVSDSLCNLMERHLSHVKLSKLELSFKARQLSTLSNSDQSASSAVALFSISQERYRPREPFKVKLWVKAGSRGESRPPSSTQDSQLLGYVQACFQQLLVPATIGSISEVRSRRALTPPGSAFASCTRTSSSVGFVHLLGVDPIYFYDEGTCRQAVVVLRWDGEKGAKEALGFMKRACTCNWFDQTVPIHSARYTLNGDYDFLLDLLKPLDRTGVGSVPSLKQLTAKLVLDSSAGAALAASSEDPRGLRFDDDKVPQEVLEYMRHQEEVVLLGSKMRYLFECSEQPQQQPQQQQQQQASSQPRKLSAHVVLPFLEYCASMTLRPHPRTLVCEYLDLSKQKDGSVQICARAFKGSVLNVDNFYGETLRLLEQ